MIGRYRIPEGLRVLSDGTWRAGDAAISQPRRLRYLKRNLLFDQEGAFLTDGDRRLPVALDGPPFQVESIVFDAEHGEVRVLLDDGSEERLSDAIVKMSPASGQFECAVKDGRARAMFSEAAHDTLLDLLEHQGEDFFVPLGAQRCRVVP
jgi:hypothetical protein